MNKIKNSKNISGDFSTTPTAPLKMTKGADCHSINLRRLDNLSAPQDQGALPSNDKKNQKNTHPRRDEVASLPSLTAHLLRQDQHTAQRERGKLSQPKSTGIYIHYPFCLSKCSYCDFNSAVRKDINNKQILSALLRDLHYYKEMTGLREIDTVYFGGGTPSLMEPEMVKTIIDEIKNLFTIKQDAEITIEANPLTAEINKFQAFKEAGINRISIGIQSFLDKGLRTLGRTHDVEQAKEALTMAKKIFNRSSFDLIYGWEGQTLDDWKDELNTALQYENGHISLYQLTIYEGTALHSAGVKEIDDEQSLLFQKTARDILASEEIIQYEISNYARKGQESQHNLIYWHYDDYIGIGVGASSRLTVNGSKIALQNQNSINEWLKNCSPEIETLSLEEQAEEYLLMGLRLNKGIDIEDFRAKTGVDLQQLIDSKSELSIFLEIEQGFLKATENGLNCLDSVVNKLI